MPKEIKKTVKAKTKSKESKPEMVEALKPGAELSNGYTLQLNNKAEDIRGKTANIPVTLKYKARWKVYFAGEQLLTQH